MSADWIERKEGDKRPALPRNARVEIEHRNGFKQRTTAACVDWGLKRVSSDVVRYRLAAAEVRTVS